MKFFAYISRLEPRSKYPASVPTPEQAFVKLDSFVEFLPYESKLDLIKETENVLVVIIPFAWASWL